VLGQAFVGNTAATTAWHILYWGAFLLALRYRVLTPMWLNLRQRMRVERVEPEAPGVYSVYIRARNTKAVNLTRPLKDRACG
jgi:hypothetical protein